MKIIKGLPGIIGLALMIIAATIGTASAADSLTHFFTAFKTLQADFEQIQVDDRQRVVQKMRGTMVIDRPGRFRWDYSIPYEQQIIADGHKVWLYDIDLEQVTVKAQDATLGGTPAALLSSGKALDDAFVISESSLTEGGMRWFELTPKTKDATFERLLMGMKEGVLRRMTLWDSFGQQTELYFDNVVVDGAVDPKLFKFTPPEGVDVIDETAQP